MDWNRIEGNWKQFKGRAKEKWGRLTDDDLDVINGRQDQLEGKIQERYGLAKDQAKKDVDTWFQVTAVNKYTGASWVQASCI
jgi:uncharacterized protein YjbJ (UPF0337 family)